MQHIKWKKFCNKIDKMLDKGNKINKIHGTSRMNKTGQKIEITEINEMIEIDEN